MNRDTLLTTRGVLGLYIVCFWIIRLWWAW
jgi:hypothetical protein